MNFDTDSLNRQYFGFLENEYGFKYSKGVFSTQDIEIQISATGFTSGVLSSVEIYVWFKEEPPCTRILFEWILMHYIDAHLYLDDSLLRNYQRLSSAFREHASKVLSHREEWLLSSMKIHFGWMLNHFYKGNLQALLMTKNISDMYEYIKS